MQRRHAERMLYVVAYDIPNDKRRTRIHKALSGYGRWTQYSLFECHLDRKEFVALQAKLNKLLNPQEDSLRFYPLCTACVAKVETVGSEKPAEERIYIL